MVFVGHGLRRLAIVLEGIWRVGRAVSQVCGCEAVGLYLWGFVFKGAALNGDAQAKRPANGLSIVTVGVTHRRSPRSPAPPLGGDPCHKKRARNRGHRTPKPLIGGDCGTLWPYYRGCSRVRFVRLLLPVSGFLTTG